MHSWAWLHLKETDRPDSTASLKPALAHGPVLVSVFVKEFYRSTVIPMCLHILTAAFMLRLRYGIFVTGHRLTNRNRFPTSGLNNTDTEQMYLHPHPPPPKHTHHNLRFRGG